MMWRPEVHELDRPDSLWNRAAMASAAAQGDPLCCRSEWALTFHETLAPRQPLVLRAGTDSLVAFAMHREPGLGRLLAPLEWSWKFGQPLLGPAALDLLHATLDELSVDGRRPSLLLSGLLPGSEETSRIARSLAGWLELPQDAQDSSVASLDGGFDGWLSRRSGLMRRNLRKAERRAAARGLHFERCAPGDAAAASALFRRMLAVEGRSWKGLEQTGIADPDAARFYARLLERMAGAGIARVLIARLGNDDVGFLFGSLAGGIFRAQQFAFDDGYRSLAIGNLLQLEALRWICEDGAGLYHMGPTMEYKRHWAEDSRRIESRLFVPPELC